MNKEVFLEIIDRTVAEGKKSAIAGKDLERCEKELAKAMEKIELLKSEVAMHQKTIAVLNNKLDESRSTISYQYDCRRELEKQIEELKKQMEGLKNGRTEDSDGSGST